MKKPAKKTSRNEEEKRWIQALTALTVVAVIAVCVCVVWRVLR